MARTSREQVQAVRYSVLSYVEQHGSSDGKCASISYREMERALGYSAAQVRWACRHLAQDGLLQCFSCFDEDGGQRANAYTIIAQGREFVRSYRSAAEPAGGEARGVSSAEGDRQRPQAVRTA